MRKIDKQIISSLEYIKGDILGIGISDDMAKTFKQKDNIHNLYTINERINNKSDDLPEQSVDEQFDIKKLNKYFTNKQLDYTICNLDVLNTYFPYFIKNIINLNDEKILFYGNKDKFDYETLIKQLKRYHSKVDYIDCGEYFLIIIDTKDIIVSSKQKIIYLINDLFVAWFDRIGNILTK